MKVIGLSGSEMVVDGVTKSFANIDYVNAVLKAGAVPLILPVCDNQTVIKEMVEQCDGIIMCGGVDIHPSYYGEDILSICEDFDVKRDRYETLLLTALSKTPKPILGICRGAQMLNVYYGGTLYQDLSQAKDCRVMHRQRGSRGHGCHQIRVEKGSFLDGIYKDGDLVNSYHHQAVKDLAKEFKVAARSSDGIIEAFEHNEKKIYAVQFHPEVMVDHDHKALEIFKQFLERIEA